MINQKNYDALFYFVFEITDYMMKKWANLRNKEKIFLNFLFIYEIQDDKKTGNRDLQMIFFDGK